MLVSDLTRSVFQLFSKLWRVNRVLQATRMKIKIEHVVGPMIVFFLLAIAVLILWTTM